MLASLSGIPHYERMFAYPGGVIPADEWERMKTEAFNRCISEHSDAGLAAMNEATGIHWCEPGIPDKLPPTPGVREGMDALDQLPRRLRRHGYRILRCNDACGAAEVIGCLYDAELEASITGDDRKAIYLEYLYEIPYAVSVLRFILAMHDWLIGNDDFELIRMLAEELCRRGLLDESFNEPTALQPSDVHQRPPPLMMRPCITSDGPPTPFGRCSGLALRVAA